MKCTCHRTVWYISFGINNHVTLKNSTTQPNKCHIHPQGWGAYISIDIYVLVCISGRVNAKFCIYSTHKNIAICKIMEAMHIAYTKSGTQSQHPPKLHMRLTITEGTWVLWKESFSISLNHLMVVKVLLKCAIRFSISSACPLAYGVRIFSKASVTADA